MIHHSRYKIVKTLYDSLRLFTAIWKPGLKTIIVELALLRLTPRLISSPSLRIHLNLRMIHHSHYKILKTQKKDSLRPFTAICKPGLKTIIVELALLRLTPRVISSPSLRIHLNLPMIHHSRYKIVKTLYDSLRLFTAIWKPGLKTIIVELALLRLTPRLISSPSLRIHLNLRMIHHSHYKILKTQKKDSLRPFTAICKPGLKTIIVELALLRLTPRVISSPSLRIHLNLPMIHHSRYKIVKTLYDSLRLFTAIWKPGLKTIIVELALLRLTPRLISSPSLRIHLNLRMIHHSHYKILKTQKKDSLRPFTAICKPGLKTIIVELALLRLTPRVISSPSLRIHLNLPMIHHSRYKIVKTLNDSLRPFTAIWKPGLKTIILELALLRLTLRLVSSPSLGIAKLM